MTPSKFCKFNSTSYVTEVRPELFESWNVGCMIYRCTSYLEDFIPEDMECSEYPTCIRLLIVSTTMKMLLWLKLNKANWIKWFRMLLHTSEKRVVKQTLS